MNKRLWWSGLVLVVVSVALVACGGDDSGDQPVAGTGGAAAAGIGGGGGASGASGTGGGGGAAGMMAVSIPCGTATCTSMMLPLPIPLPTACCADATMNQCGTMMAGGACMLPPPSDPRCPMVTSALPIPLTSCCATNGMCGLDASMLGMGCVDFDTVRTGPFGSFLPVPAATVCDPSLTEDGGVDGEDAGS